MESLVPNHHIKQTVCSTRPPYREGRHPKAVKVYTVSNESAFILIQGVPSVGTTEELRKLCSSFGSVDQLLALDDYPNQDKYTDVYLVKFTKIQSARFAKWKLDDYSFFGGTLHVCYAPEYESVAETRAKLQDRRRVVAAKIRQHAAQKAEHSKVTENQLGTTVNNICLIAYKHNPQPVQSITSPALEFTKPVQHPKTPIYSPTLCGAEHTRLRVQDSHLAQSNLTPPTCDSLRQQSEEELPQPLQSTFELPPPPRSDQSRSHQQTSSRSSYEYSKVRSAHATLPCGYDGRVLLNTFYQSERSKELVSKILPSSQETAQLNSSHSTPANNAQIIVRDYKPPGLSTPKFIPRQAVQKPGEKQERCLKPEQRIDQLNRDIRRNAFTLGESQGPAIIPTRKRPLDTSVHQSVNQTILEIRSKISKVISDNTKGKNN